MKLAAVSRALYGTRSVVAWQVKAATAGCQPRQPKATRVKHRSGYFTTADRFRDLWRWRKALEARARRLSET